MRTLRSGIRSAVWKRELCLRQECQDALSSDVVTMLRCRCVLRLTIATNVFKRCTTPRLLFLAASIIHVLSAILPTQFLWK